ncbi:hypothetical protein GQ44DRAFT_822547 [Phaeosphaeriaceae sp. PMI808]|nr:hypothetical protein GQ44DRAFT_822547 [Phaeosphaeriaceae sp. PMI808]
MSFWNFVKTSITEVIDKAATGLELYEYGNLPTKRSIRLLSFAEDEDWTYSISMTVFKLHEAPPFSALSYTWDTPYHFPHMDEDSLLSAWDSYKYWHDAYSRSTTFKCDNKRIIADLDERKAQVLSMSDIYQRAMTVIAWLSEDLPNTTMAIEGFYKLATIPFYKHEEMQNMSLEEPATYEALGIDFIDSKQLRCVAGFLGRKWFGRLWIVQEAVFAQDIIFLCGNYMIEQETLIGMGKLLILSGWSQQIIDHVSVYHEAHMPPPGGVASLALMREDMKGARERRLLNIMASTRGRQATNPLDNVYSMLNVLALVPGKEPVELEVQPDYKQSVSTVMEDTTRMLIRYESNLDVLHQVQDRSTISSIDYSSTRTASWTLTFRAARIGTIENIADKFHATLLPQIELALQLCGQPYGVHTTQSLSKILWRTTLADCAGLQHPAPQHLSDAWVDFMLNGHDDYSRDTMEHGIGSLWQSQQDDILLKSID